jgi:hypothetical protein
MARQHFCLFCKNQQHRWYMLFSAGLGAKIKHPSIGSQKVTCALLRVVQGSKQQ